MSRVADTLDLTAVSDRTGLTTATIRSYHNNGTLPAPDGTAGQSPWWFSETIDDWAAARARASRRRDLCQLVPTSADTWEAWVAGQHVGYVVTGESRAPGSNYFCALPLSAAGHPSPRLAAVGYGLTPGHAALTFVGARVPAAAGDPALIAEQIGVNVEQVDQARLVLQRAGLNPDDPTAVKITVAVTAELRRSETAGQDPNPARG